MSVFHLFSLGSISLDADHKEENEFVLNIAQQVPWSPFLFCRRKMDAGTFRSRVDGAGQGFYKRILTPLCGCLP